MSEQVNTDIPVTEPITSIVEANNEPIVGEYTGQCKWWSDKLGFGFVTIVSPGPMKGKDIFLHHSGIRPLNSNYRTLHNGEYINFDVVDGAKGLQGTNVTGIGGGTLICDVNPYVKHTPRAQLVTPPQPPPPPPPSMHQYNPYGAPPQHTIASAAYATHTAYRGGFRSQVTRTPSRFARPYYRPRAVTSSATPPTTQPTEAPSEST